MEYFTLEKIAIKDGDCGEKEIYIYSIQLHIYSVQHQTSFIWPKSDVRHLMSEVHSLKS